MEFAPAVTPEMFGPVVRFRVEGGNDEMTRVTMAVLLGGMAGCATVASGSYGVPVDEPHGGSKAPAPPQPATEMRVSAGELPQLASPYFGAVEVTFENPSPAWIQVDRVDIDFGSPQRNQAVFVPWGADIDAWRQAAVDSLAIGYAGSRLQMLAVGGDAIAARDRHGSSTPAGGGTIPVGALGTLAATPAPGSPAQGALAEPGEPFPPSHLLSLPIRVPPGLFAKRWILFYTSDSPPGGCIESMVLGYTTSDGKHQRVLVHFKEPVSAWQAPACGPAVPGKPF